MTKSPARDRGAIAVPGLEVLDDPEVVMCSRDERSGRLREASRVRSELVELVGLLDLHVTGAPVLERDRDLAEEAVGGEALEVARQPRHRLVLVGPRAAAGPGVHDGW